MPGLTIFLVQWGKYSLCFRKNPFPCASAWESSRRLFPSHPMISRIPSRMLNVVWKKALVARRCRAQFQPPSGICSRNIYSTSPTTRESSFRNHDRHWRNIPVTQVLATTFPWHREVPAWSASEWRYRLVRASEFTRVVQKAHRGLRVGWIPWLFGSNPRNVLSAPFIYAMFLPLFF